MLAQAVSAVMCLLYAFRKYPELHLSGQDFHAEVCVYAQHLGQGLPMGLQFSALAIGIIVMQRALVGFDIGPDGIMAAGNPAQNRFGAANKLNNFLMCPMNALSTAIVSFNAQNLGAGRQDRIRRGTGRADDFAGARAVDKRSAAVYYTMGGCVPAGSQAKSLTAVFVPAEV